jgi:hypothetical protein
MPTGKPVTIPFPLSSFPGANPQEGGGRLINCYAEPLGEAQRPTGPQPQVWRRSAGLSQHAATAQSGYRGGLLVDNLAYEAWKNNASTVDVNGVVASLGNLSGTKRITIARNQGGGATPDVVAVDVDNGAYVLQAQPVVPATLTATIGGAGFTAGDTVALTFTNYASNVPPSPAAPVTVTYTLGAGESANSIAAGLNTLINANGTLGAANITSTVHNAVISIQQKGVIGNETTVQTAVSGSASITATIGGTVFHTGDTVALTFNNTQIAGFPITVTYTLGAGESTTTIATGLKNLVNANATLANVNITATSALAVVTISQSGAVIGQVTNLTDAVTGTGNETVAFNPLSGNMTPASNETITLAPSDGQLSGGAGVVGIWNGAPTAYNGGGNLPQPNSVAFQDGYFFFTIASGQVYASAINLLTQNALTFITCGAKADVTLLRAIPYGGIMLFFTTGSCEAWQDAALAAPNFPYSRLAVLETGLLQYTAIAGFETGFSELAWVAQDYGVYRMEPGSLAPTKVSPPDLDRLIEGQSKLGNVLEASCYTYGGKKFWALSSPAWTWELCITGKPRWAERWSIAASGAYGRWRATGGHAAFGKTLVGDILTGNLLYVDDQNFTENGAILLMRMESGPVRDFPQQLRIARADFDFVMGVGLVEGNLQMIVVGAVSGTNGVVRLTVNNTAQANTGDEAIVVAVGGTTEANGTWPITVIDASHIELVGSVFKNAYTSGGIATDVTVPPNAVNPQVAISCSKDGGLSYGNPLVRSLGAQGKSKRTRASVKNMGQSGAIGDRWRLDVTDPVYCGFLGGTQSSDPREVRP